MRNIIIIALAILSLTACTREEINNTPQSDAITFGNSVMEYSASTRATILDNNTLNSFRVWGFYKDNDAQTVFDGTLVQKNNDEWGYEGPTRYWIPDRNYYFAATAPISDNIAVTPKMDMDSESAINSITFTNKGKEDLIYGKIQQTATYSGNNPSAVTLNFQHLLSKVIFSFKNSVDPYLNMKISDIKVTIPGEASINLAGNTKVWEVNESAGLYQVETNSTTPELIATDGTGVSEDLFFIPTETEYNVSFKITLLMDGVSEVLYSKTHTATIPSVNLDMGKAYNFSADISHDVITGSEDLQFEIIHLQNWDLETPQSGYEYWNTFGDLSKLLVASKLGGEVTLNNYVEIIDPITVTDTLTLNLNGQTLEYKGSAQSLFSVIKDNKDDYEYGDPSIFTINGNDNGNSKIISTTTIAIVNENTDMVINGGYHETSGSTAYKSINGNILINDGKFQSSDYTQLFSQSENGTIKIIGGSFYKWDPESYVWDELSIENSRHIYYKPAEDDTVTQDRKEWYHIKKIVTVDDATNPERVEHFQDLLNNDKIGKINVKGSIDKDLGLTNKVYTFTITNDITIDFSNIETTLKCYYYGFLINGAKVEFKNMNLNSHGIAMMNGAEVTFYGERNDLMGWKNGGRYGFIVSDSKLIVKNGHFSNKTTNNLRIDQRYLYALGNSEVLIEGGKWGFENTYTPDVPMYVYSPATLEITGGEFNFNPDDIVNTGTIYISGGTFTSTTEPTKHLAEGYRYVSSGTNKWTVEKIQ